MAIGEFLERLADPGAGGRHVATKRYQSITRIATALEHGPLRRHRPC